MIGYFFNRDKHFNKKVMYVPKNVIMIGDKEGIDINYFPNNLVVFDELWNKDRRRLLGNFKYSLINIVDIPDSFLKEFRDCCFKENHVLAHLLALEIFQETERAIAYFRKNANKI